MYEKDSVHPKGIWNGTLYWNDEAEITLTFFQHYVNDKLVTGTSDTSLFQKTTGKNFSFISFGEKREKEDELSIVFGWKDSRNGEEQIEEIKLVRQ
ncbi:hypothetical protein QA612_16530 [Evansella sp. AB-P1]|uniref:hypothetical protein n=1 Tax=Evansella sp. AB-P1 TaxID=3037653 RepID=UPI00241F3596|nr:hypothetical protein [Evansella sp. AB-P1]MDG5789065.1 hypothetical protein [Evansella sp. AB-P1]